MAETNTLTRHAPKHFDAIIAHLAAGRDFVDISAIDGMPSLATLYLLADESEEVRNGLARARRNKADRLILEAQAIADGPLEEDARKASAGVQRNAQRVGFRQWLAARFHRELYGERTALDITGTISALIAYGDMRPPVIDADVVDAAGPPHVAAPDETT